MEKKFGRLPYYKGDWTVGTVAMHKWRYTYKGSELQSLIDNNVLPPIDDNENVNTGWKMISQGHDVVQQKGQSTIAVMSQKAVTDELDSMLYDVSAYNPTGGPNNDGKFTLDYILDNAGTLIPTSVRKGGMSIKFVQTSDNKYVQYRLMSNTFNTIVANWQGVDEEPTAGSNNLAESGGVVQNIILSHRNFEVLENYTETSTEGMVSHKIKPYNGGDLLVVYVGNLNGRIKVTGPTEHKGTGVRYSFWNTARIEDCTNENFISWARYAENATVEIPSGAKMMALHLVREDYSGGYDGIQVNVFPHQQTGEKKILSVKGELTYTVTEDSAFTVSGIVLPRSDYDIFSYTVDDSKEYCISLFSQGSGIFITAVGYYDSYGKFLGAEYIRKEGEDSILNRNFLTLPQGTVTVKVNVYKGLYNVKVEEIVVSRTQGDEYTKKIYDFDGVSIMTEDELEYIDNKYLTTGGAVADSGNSKISLPIHLNSGDSVIVNTNILSACVIAEYKDDEYIPLLNAWSNRRSCSYVCNKSEMDICICGRKDMKITVCRFRYSSRLVKKEDIEPTIIGDKYINYDGSIIDSSSGNWDVYVYDINPRNMYAFTGGMNVNNTGNVIFYYDKNDSFICSFLCGSPDVAMWWDDIFIYVPLNAVKARVNVRKSIGCSLKLALRNESYIEPSEYGGLPSYYDSYMKSRAADVNKAFIYANPNTTSFCFSSDLHYPINQNLGRLVAKVLDTTKVTAFVCGGDIPNKSLNYGEEVTPEEALMMTFNEYENDLSIIRSTGKSVYTLRGNHDFAINKDYGSEGAVYVDYKTTRNMLMNDNFLIPGIVFNESDDVGCYFYKDFPVAKTRYIFLDTTDSNGNDGQNSKSPYVSDTQMGWIASQAVLTCPSDYNLVILSHIYIQRNCGTADSYSSYHNFDNLRTLFAAVQNKTNCTILGQSYDFSSFAPNILFHIAGHNHRDTAVFMDGFWSFTTAANYKSKELPKSPLYQHFPINTKYVYNGKGTIYENLTDAVLVNGEVSVEVFRFGAGYDREFRQAPYTVSAGSTLQIESSMEAEDIEWWCHDSIGRASSSDGIIVYNNNFATIDKETGLLTAIAAGYVTVVAFSESLNKVEYIGVKVS